MTLLNVPELLVIPPKLNPIITDFNLFRYCLLEGGRGSAKTHSVARILLYLAGQKKLRIVCGREVQNSIEESVYTVLKDIIEKYNLYYEIKATKIIHRQTGSQFIFKGFREQGNVGIKGLEGVDVLWIDEAQSITNGTLEVLIPTIRSDNARLFFTMNRFMRDDAVYEFLYGRSDTLHIHIDYFDNPFCPQSTKNEALTLKAKSEKEYNHIYLGKPLDSAGDYLFNYDKLYEAYDTKPYGELFYPQRVIGIDFAAQGNDQCVASILDRVSNVHWKLTEQIAWDENDSTISIGKIVTLLGEHKPDVSILDVGGMGTIVHDRLIELKVPIQRFDGASTDGVDKTKYVNARANGYYDTKDWFDRGYIILDPHQKQVVKELEKIRMKFRSDGRRLLQPKAEMKKDLKYSPDYADSLMMAIWAATHFIGQANSYAQADNQIRRKTNHRRQARAVRH